MPESRLWLLFVDGSLTAFGNFLSLTWDDSGGYRNIIFPHSPPFPSRPLQLR